MSQGNRKNSNIVTMKRRRKISFVGVLLFAFALYVLALFVKSATQEHLSIYEVTETQIADDETIRGMILRNEQLVTTDQAGYVNYYVGESSRVGLRTNVYSLDSTGDVAEKLATMDTENIKLTEEDTQNIRDNITNFRENFSLSDYSKISNFRYDLDNTVLELSAVDLSKRLEQLMKEDGAATAFQVVKAKKTGVISFCTDGYEDVKYNEIKDSYFDSTVDKWTQIRSSDKLKANSPVYRIVTSENWSIVLSLTDKQYDKIKDKKTLSVTLRKDDLRLTVPVTTYQNDNHWYARLDLDKYMVRYLQMRYIDVHIEFNHAQGLKIPQSSIVKKKCYVFPKDYLQKVTENADTSNGIMVIDPSKKTLAKADGVILDVYYIDDDGYVYIDADAFDPGTEIVQTDKNGNYSSTMYLSETRELEGVYNCNQGYCRFQIIDKLYENEEYAIVKSGTTYGLAGYDHIVLNPDLIRSDQIIY